MTSNKNRSREIKTSDDLSALVKSFWYYNNAETDCKDFSILPDGCFVLLIDFVDCKMKSSYLTGLWNKKIEVSVRPQTEVYAIRFKPLASEYIIKQKIADLLNTGVKIPNIKYPFLKHLDYKYQDFDSFVKSNTLILKSILETGKSIDTRKHKLFHRLYENGGAISLGRISEEVAWSDRQIRRYFNDIYGLSFKDYANILRLNSTYKDLVKGVHYTDTNYYFDQSHYIKEIRKYTGVNPKTLIKNKTTDFYNFELGV